MPQAAASTVTPTTPAKPVDERVTAAADAAADDILALDNPDTILEGTEETPAETTDEVEEEAEAEADDAAEAAKPITDEEAEQAAADGDEAEAEGVDEGAAEEAKTPEPAAEPEPEPVAEDPAAVEARKKAGDDYAKWEADFTAVTAKLQSGELDPIDDAAELNKALKVLAKGMEYVKGGLQEIGQQRQAETQAQTAKQQAEAYWQDFGQKNPGLKVEDVRTAFAEEVEVARKEFPGASRETIQAVASKGWERRIEDMKAGKKPAAPAAAKPAAPVKAGAPAGKPKPVLNKGGARVTPASGTARPPKPKPKTPDEEFDATVGAGALDFLS